MCGKSEFEERIIRTEVNETSNVGVISGVGAECFEFYLKKYESECYLQKEYYENGTHRFAAFEKDGVGVFLNFFGSVGIVTIAEEKNCNYFGFADEMREIRVPAQITQVHLEDFGMSYVVRLADGRFVVIDGGWNLEPDIDRLFECLQHGNVYEKPIIAAWILTHPHCDH